MRLCRRAIAIGWTASVTACAILACSSSDSGVGPSDAGLGESSRLDVDASTCSTTAAAPCSTGPAYDDKTKFPIDNNDQEVCRLCTARCGVSISGTIPTAAYPLEALPSGSCSVDGETCSMGGSVTCHCGMQGPVNEYKCRCQSGQWSCKIVVQGSAGCACPPDGGDGGTDADAAD